MWGARGGASHAGADRPGRRGGFRPRLRRAEPARCGRSRASTGRRGRRARASAVGERRRSVWRARLARRRLPLSWRRRRCRPRPSWPARPTARAENPAVIAPAPRLPRPGTAVGRRARRDPCRQPVRTTGKRRRIRPALRPGPTGPSWAGRAHIASRVRRAHRAGRSVGSARRARQGALPSRHSAVARPWSPVLVLVATSRRGTQPAVPARRRGLAQRTRAPTSSRRARSRRASAVTTSPLAAPTLASPAARRSGGQRRGRRRRRSGRGRRGSSRFRRPVHSSSLVAGALRPGACPSAIGVSSISRLERPG